MNDTDPSPPSLRRVNILGTRVTASSFAAAQASLADRVRARRPAVLSAATVYSVMLGHSRPDYQATVNRADYVMADGMPLVWAMRLLGQSAERVHGDDFFLSTCQRFPAWRHFLLGGAKGQPEKAAEELRRRFPTIQIVGTYATPVRPVPAPETAHIVRAIHEAEAEVVWVGMGTPAQDEWMVAHVNQVGVPLVGVGSAFDVLAGQTRTAPDWVKRSGLQWLFRLIQEPHRLWRRYLIYNPLFIWRLTLQLSGLKRYES